MRRTKLIRMTLTAAGVVAALAIVFVVFGTQKQFSIDFVTPRTPKEIRIANATKLTVLVHVFNPTDTLRLIPRQAWTLPGGDSVTYPYGAYHVRVGTPGILGVMAQPVAEKLRVASDVTIKGGRSGLTIDGQPKRAVSFKNDTSERVKACIYNADDRVQAVPRIPCFTMDVGDSTTRAELDEPFLLKIFRPQLIDHELAAEVVPDQSAITLRSRRAVTWW